MATFTFDRTNLLIIVDTPDTEVTIQELWNAIQDYQDELSSIDLNEIGNASGKQDLGGDVSVGITLELNEGWRVQFEDRGSETICTVSGGNLVGKDLDTDISYFPLAFSTNVLATRSVSSSATLQEQELIQFSSFNGMVHIDQSSSNSGIDFPNGNAEYPVNNITDAKIIAIERGFDIMHIHHGDLIIGATDDVSGYDIRAGNPLNVSIILTPGCITNNTIFRHSTIYGTASGNCLIYESIIIDLAGFSGTINECGFMGTITLAGSTTSHIVQCYDGFEGFGEPIIDFGGSGRGLNMRNYQGGLRFENKSGSEDVSIGLNGGRLEIAADITNGEIIVRGNGIISENLGTATVNDSGLVDQRVMKMTNDYLINKMTLDDTTRAPAVYLQIWNTTGDTILYEHRVVDHEGSDPTIEDDAIADRGVQTTI